MPLIEYTFEVGDESFSVVARDYDEAFDRASTHAVLSGLTDGELRCVEYAPYDPSGGDGPED